ncbi:MAG TPA: ATP-binding protein [Planctomycetota bacterium]|nr:ATP-binding protein [Planctomycetota bacterium]
MAARRLLWQIYPAYLLITALSLAAVGWYASREAREFYLAQTAADLEARARLVEGRLGALLPPDGGADAPALDAECKRLDRAAATRITVILPDGRVAGDSEERPAAMANHADRPEVRAALSGRTGLATRHSETLGEDMMYVAVPLEAGGRGAGAVRTAVPLTHINRALRVIYLQIGLGGLAVALLAAGAGLVVYRRMSRPLEEIRLGAERLARGDLATRLTVSDSGEAARLAEALNRMAERLRRLETVRQEFVANVSHELKTPITSIKGFVETLLDGAAENPEDARKFLEIVARHADRLNSIIGDLLLLSRIEEGGDRPLELGEVPLRDVLRAAVEACAAKTGAKGVAVYLDCPNELTVRASPPLLEQAVVNLIDNAVKYSEPGSPIHVEGCAEVGGGAAVAVRDRGQGIAPEHLPRLGERFYRVDKARSRQAGGTGLGLAIVKHIAQAHGGRVSVESRVGEGSVFRIHLPGGG